MQFADEELRHVHAEFAVREGVSGHLQPVQRIDSRCGITEGFEDSGERADARRQCAGRTLRKTHGAQCPMIESNALMRAAPVGDVGSAARHPLEQVLEQQRVERHGEDGAAHLRRTGQFTWIFRREKPDRFAACPKSPPPPARRRSLGSGAQGGSRSGGVARPPAPPSRSTGRSDWRGMPCSPISSWRIRPDCGNLCRRSACRAPRKCRPRW